MIENTVNDGNKQPKKAENVQEIGKRFLEGLKKQGPSYDKMGKSFIARSSKLRSK